MKPNNAFKILLCYLAISTSYAQDHQLSCPLIVETNSERYLVLNPDIKSENPTVVFKNKSPLPSEKYVAIQNKNVHLLVFPEELYISCEYIVQHQLNEQVSKNESRELSISFSSEDYDYNSIQLNGHDLDWYLTHGLSSGNCTTKNHPDDCRITWRTYEEKS